MGLDSSIYRKEHGAGDGVEVAYWRKANAIHRFFIELNGGKDYHEDIPIEEKDLRELLRRCKEIKAQARLVNGKVVDYYTIENGGQKAHYVDGQIIDNPAICEELLPTQSGFFFGKTDYDEDYMYSIDKTIEQLEEILADHKDDDEYYYYGSW